MMILILGAVSSFDPEGVASQDSSVGICNKDAEVVCLGCEGDPYCEECWQEGHVGERHRTKRFAAKGGRKAVGA
jgi:hypothetical protein